MSKKVLTDYHKQFIAKKSKNSASFTTGNTLLCDLLNSIPLPCKSKTTFFEYTLSTLEYVCDGAQFLRITLHDLFGKFDVLHRVCPLALKLIFISR